MRKIKTGDQVIVNTGKYRGKQGTVLRMIEDGKRALVEGINIVKKHVKPNPRANQQGGILEREAPINISNIAVLNPATDKADRVGFKFLEDGRKVRVFKSNGELVDIEG